MRPALRPVDINVDKRQISSDLIVSKRNFSIIPRNSDQQDENAVPTQSKRPKLSRSDVDFPPIRKAVSHAMSRDGDLHNIEIRELLQSFRENSAETEAAIFKVASSGYLHPSEFRRHLSAIHIPERSSCLSQFPSNMLINRCATLNAQNISTEKEILCLLDDMNITTAQEMFPCVEVRWKFLHENGVTRDLLPLCAPAPIGKPAYDSAVNEFTRTESSITTSSRKSDVENVACLQTVSNTVLEAANLRPVDHCLHNGLESVHVVDDNPFMTRRALERTPAKGDVDSGSNAFDINCTQGQSDVDDIYAQTFVASGKVTASGRFETKQFSQALQEDLNSSSLSSSSGSTAKYSIAELQEAADALQRVSERIACASASSSSLTKSDEEQPAHEDHERSTATTTLANWREEIERLRDELEENKAELQAVCEEKEYLSQRLEEAEQQLQESSSQLQTVQEETKEAIECRELARIDAELRATMECVGKLEAFKDLIAQRHLLRAERLGRMEAEAAAAAVKLSMRALERRYYSYLEALEARQQQQQQQQQIDDQYKFGPEFNPVASDADLVHNGSSADEEDEIARLHCSMDVVAVAPLATYLGCGHSENVFFPTASVAGARSRILSPSFIPPFKTPEQPIVPLAGVPLRQPRAQHGCIAASMTSSSSLSSSFGDRVETENRKRFDGGKSGSAFRTFVRTWSPSCIPPFKEPEQPIVPWPGLPLMAPRVLFPLTNIAASAASLVYRGRSKIGAVNAGCAFSAFRRPTPKAESSQSQTQSQLSSRLQSQQLTVESLSAAFATGSDKLIALICSSKSQVKESSTFLPVDPEAVAEGEEIANSSANSSRDSLDPPVAAGLATTAVTGAIARSGSLSPACEERDEMTMAGQDACSLAVPASAAAADDVLVPLDCTESSAVSRDASRASISQQQEQQQQQEDSLGDDYSPCDVGANDSFDLPLDLDCPLVTEREVEEGLDSHQPPGLSHDAHVTQLIGQFEGQEATQVDSKQDDVKDSREQQQVDHQELRVVRQDGPPQTGKERKEKRAKEPPRNRLRLIPVTVPPVWPQPAGLVDGLGWEGDERKLTYRTEVKSELSDEEVDGCADGDGEEIDGMIDSAAGAPRRGRKGPKGSNARKVTSVSGNVGDARDDDEGGGGGKGLVSSAPTSRAKGSINRSSKSGTRNTKGASSSGSRARSSLSMSSLSSLGSVVNSSSGNIKQASSDVAVASAAATAAAAANDEQFEVKGAESEPFNGGVEDGEDAGLFVSAVLAAPKTSSKVVETVPQKQHAKAKSCKDEKTKSRKGKGSSISLGLDAVRSTQDEDCAVEHPPPQQQNQGGDASTKAKNSTKGRGSKISVKGSRMMGAIIKDEVEACNTAAIISAGKASSSSRPLASKQRDSDGAEASATIASTASIAPEEPAVVTVADRQQPHSPQSKKRMVQQAMAAADRDRRLEEPLARKKKSAVAQFCAHVEEQVVRANPDFGAAEVAKTSMVMWKALSAAERAGWVQRAEEGAQLLEGEKAVNCDVAGGVISDIGNSKAASINVEPTPVCMEAPANVDAMEASAGKSSRASKSKRGATVPVQVQEDSLQTAAVAEIETEGDHDEGDVVPSTVADIKKASSSATGTSTSNNKSKQGGSRAGSERKVDSSSSDTEEAPAKKPRKGRKILGRDTALAETSSKPVIKEAKASTKTPVLEQTEAASTMAAASAAEIASSALVDATLSLSPVVGSRASSPAVVRLLRTGGSDVFEPDFIFASRTAAPRFGAGAGAAMSLSGGGLDVISAQEKENELKPIGFKQYVHRRDVGSKASAQVVFGDEEPEFDGDANFDVGEDGMAGVDVNRAATAAEGATAAASAVDTVSGKKRGKAGGKTAVKKAALKSTTEIFDAVATIPVHDEVYGIATDENCGSDSGAAQQGKVAQLIDKASAKSKQAPATRKVSAKAGKGKAKNNSGGESMGFFDLVESMDSIESILAAASSVLGLPTDTALDEAKPTVASFSAGAQDARIARSRKAPAEAMAAAAPSSSSSSSFSSSSTPPPSTRTAAVISIVPSMTNAMPPPSTKGANKRKAAAVPAVPSSQPGSSDQSAAASKSSSTDIVDKENMKPALTNAQRASRHTALKSVDVLDSDEQLGHKEKKLKQGPPPRDRLSVEPKTGGPSRRPAGPAPQPSPKFRGLEAFKPQSTKSLLNTSVSTIASIMSRSSATAKFVLPKLKSSVANAVAL